MRTIVALTVAGVLVAGCKVSKPASDTAAPPMGAAPAAVTGDSAGMPANMTANMPTRATPSGSKSTAPAPAPAPAPAAGGTSVRPGSAPGVAPTGGVPGTRPGGAMMTRQGAQLLDVEQRLTTAIAKHDEGALNTLVSPSFPDRQNWIDNHLNVRVTSTLFANPELGSVGDQGTVTGDFYWTGMRNETKLNETQHVRDSWTLSGGNWQLVKREVLSRHVGAPVVKPSGKL